MVAILELLVVVLMLSFVALTIATVIRYVWNRHADCSWGKHVWGPWEAKSGDQQARECNICGFREKRYY